MGKVYPGLDDRLRAFIEAQPLFFVGTAPLSAHGSVNVSPKGVDGSLAVLDEHTVAYRLRISSTRRRPVRSSWSTYTGSATRAATACRSPQGSRTGTCSWATVEWSLLPPSYDAWLDPNNFDAAGRQRRPLRFDAPAT